MANQKQTLAILNRYKDSFAERFGITALGIFGSVARNEDREDSDVDIVVKMTNPDFFFYLFIGS